MAESSAEFIRKFSELASRLALSGIVVQELQLSWSSFGSWRLVVAKHHEEIRFTYDGRDSLVSVESQPSRSSSHRLGGWKELAARRIDGQCDGAISFVEEFLAKHFDP